MSYERKHNGESAAAKNLINSINSINCDMVNLFNKPEEPKYETKVFVACTYEEARELSYNKMREHWDRFSSMSGVMKFGDIYKVEMKLRRKN